MLWDEAFHFSQVAVAGNAEMTKVPRDVTDRIYIIPKPDSPSKHASTYDEYAKILKAI